MNVFKCCRKRELASLNVLPYGFQAAYDVTDICREIPDANAAYWTSEGKV